MTDEEKARARDAAYEKWAATIRAIGLEPSQGDFYAGWLARDELERKGQP